jgi:phosphatidylglycerol lysyltransferase
MTVDVDRSRALAILRGHAWTTVSFQLLEREFRYWFDGDDAFVAYVDTGSAWVAGGAPVTSPERLVEVARKFATAARAAGRRASFFGCEQRFVDASTLPAIRIGEQPIWSPRAWEATLARTSSLRYQLRRARKKGVTVRAVEPAELADPSAPLHAAIAALGGEWLATRKMAPMGFLVQLEPLTFSEERVLLVAERGGTIVGFLSGVPVYARRRLFVEDILRTRTAPNGTTELLVDAAMRAAATRGDLGVTLGLAPLAGPVAPILRLARTLSRPLYDFRGVHAFKAKLRPEHWEPVYVCATSPWLGLRDGLAAFAGGSLIKFGLKTLTRQRRLAALALLAFGGFAALLFVLVA